jgi:SAM-dependent methyltransferase
VSVDGEEYGRSMPPPNRPDARLGNRDRDALLARLGIEPTMSARLRATLEAAVAEAERRSPGSVAVLDAGCGRKSALIPFRHRIDRFVGVDLHAPDPPLRYLDEFAIADLCRPYGAFPDDTFDLILSNFTLEHFVDPPMALANLYRWLRPGGPLVVTTVNRRHPFVAAYLGLPVGPRHRLQPFVKASAADAHPLVGRCNDPATIRAALGSAGFERIELETVANLARAWGRRLPTFALGAVGDLIAQSSPSRRSTILAVAYKPPQAQPV